MNKLHICEGQLYLLHVIYLDILFYVASIVNYNAEVDNKGNTFFARDFFRCQGNIVNNVQQSFEKNDLKHDR